MRIGSVDGKTPLVLYLYCDTSAPWNFQRRWNTDDQPHAVRVAVLLYSQSTGMVRSASWILRVPKNAYFDRGSVARHRITRDVCDAIGVEPSIALARVDKIMSMMTSSAETMPGFCAYAPDWHTRVLKATANRAKHPPNTSLWEVCDRDWWCAMRAATPVLALPGKGGKGFRFPTLEVAYDYLTGMQLPDNADPVAAGERRVRAVHEIDLATDRIMAAAERLNS